jgi:hypothetical protein
MAPYCVPFSVIKTPPNIPISEDIKAQVKQVTE